MSHSEPPSSQADLLRRRFRQSFAPPKEVGEDVIQQILENLPVKSLVRFEGVCKTWFSTITSPPLSGKLLGSVLICQDATMFSTVTIQSLLAGKNETPTPVFLPWETPEAQSTLFTKLPTDGNYLIGSCRGLVCINHKCKKPDCGNDLILWKPSTRIFWKLPRRSQVGTDYNYKHLVWFGFDESIDDYKLVWIQYNLLEFSEKKLHVFTVKSNTWKTTDCGFDLRIRFNTETNPPVIGIQSNGSVYWRTRTTADNRESVILAFDLATEEFEVRFDNFPFLFDDHGGGGGCFCGYGVGSVITGGMNLVEECGGQGIVLQKQKKNHVWSEYVWSEYFPILFSSGKECLVVIGRTCHKHKAVGGTYRIVKFKIEEGGKQVSSPETVLDVPIGWSLCRNNIVLHV